MFDDRLATVLRMRTASAAGERTQFRQLLDLLGSQTSAFNGLRMAAICDRMAQLPDTEVDRLIYAPAAKGLNPLLMKAAGFVRLREIANSLPGAEQASILRASELRLRSPEMVGFLAASEPRIAASAMAIARLTQEEWQELIPALPVTARGFLRHRRDLPDGATSTLQRLGVGDLTLPDPRNGTPRTVSSGNEAPAIALIEAETSPPPALPTALKTPEEELILDSGDAIEAEGSAIAFANPAPSGMRLPSDAPQISAILARIARYRETRSAPVQAPRLPLGDSVDADTPARITSFDVVTDAEGRVIAASDTVAPWVTGMLLTAPRPTALVSHSKPVRLALSQYQPLRQAPVQINCAQQISGEWRIEATPKFESPRGNFAGYHCRLRRPVMAGPAQSGHDSQADRMRQILHELRTPVGAIQGFAEIIQQQMFGPAPHEYRAHAAAISVDAARLLAGFDEIDRLAKLESAAQSLESGACDFRAVLSATLQRLAGVLRPRSATLELAATGGPFDIGITDGEAQTLSWRILATIAGAMGPGETVTLHLHGTGDDLQLACTLPAPLHAQQMQTDASSARRPVVSAGMFGPKFAFRLAEAEAKAAGGLLQTQDRSLALTMPVLTAAARAHSTGEEQARG